MTQPAQAPEHVSDPEAFAFVQSLAAELSRGKVELPSFPDIAMRVRQVLADEGVTQDKVVLVVGSEPALAARLLQIANSAALNFSGRRITDLRSAIARLGFNMVRSAAIAFAMSQLKKVEALKGLEQPLDQLWRRSAAVAATCHVVARRFTRVNPDTALLSGLLHGIGELYILTRAARHPRLFNDPAVYERIVSDWSGSVARALLENWEMPEEVVSAVGDYQDTQRSHGGATDLTDVLTTGYLLSNLDERSEDLAPLTADVAAFQRMKIDANTLAKLRSESREEIEALRQALGV